MPSPKIPFDGDRPPATEELTAERARKLSESAESINGEFARIETQAVLKEIELSAKQAKRTCIPHFPSQHKDLIIKRLQKLGYTVKHHEGDYRDHDPGYHSVSW